MSDRFSPGWVRRMFLSVCVLALGLGFMLADIGCASEGTNVQTLQGVKIEKGVTTEQELVAQLGPPQTTTTHADGTAELQWNGVKTTTNAADAVSDMILPGIGYFEPNSMQTQSSILIATINPAGIVTDYSLTNTNTTRGLYN